MTQRLLEHLKDLARRVAQHEMGHYVIARAMGFRTGDVSVEIIGPIDGHRGAATVMLPEPTGTIDEVRSYLERRVIVLYAGAAAETLPQQHSPSKRVDVNRAIEILRKPGEGAEQDHAKVRELIHLLRNVQHSTTDSLDDVVTQRELDVLDEKLFQRAVELVERYAEAIIGLGGNLSDRVTTPKQMVTLTAAELESLPAVTEIIKISTFDQEGV